MALRFIDSMAHYATVDDIRRKWTIVSATWQGSGGRRNDPYLQFTGGQGATKTLKHTNNFIQGVASQMQPGAGNLGGTILSISHDLVVLVSLRMNADSTLSVLVGGTQVGLTTLVGRKRKPFWQDEWFDHWVRNNSERSSIIRYIPMSADCTRFLPTMPYRSRKRWDRSNRTGMYSRSQTGIVPLTPRNPSRR